MLPGTPVLAPVMDAVEAIYALLLKCSQGAMDLNHASQQWHMIAPMRS